MSNLYHVIKDPVHGTMQFTSTEDSWIKPFVDSPNFQRLRHIKQMGLGDVIFPGAVHTRFNHSLGCCYVASQIAQKIGLADEERQLVMIACLLHDLGHGPFSHVFEGVFHEKMIRHEEWTPYFIAEYSHKEFFQTYNHVNPRYHLTEQKFQEIINMIMHKPAYKNVLADIVSSQLDADRLDYLLRDAHFCGVRYGDYDFRWMLHCMAIVDSPEGERLGITYKGVGAVEHYLMARRLMIRNIYQSQKKIAIESLLIKLLSSLAKDLETHAEFAAIKQTRLGQFLIAVNQFNNTITQQHKAAHIKNFLETHYTIYKELYDYDVYALIKQLAESSINHPAVQIAHRLQARVMPRILRLEEMDLPLVENELREFKRKYHKEIQDWQIMFVQTPHQAYSGAEDPILVINEKGNISPLSEFSFMINAMSNKLEHFDFICIDESIWEDPRVLALTQRFQLMPAAV